MRRSERATLHRMTILAMALIGAILTLSPVRAATLSAAEIMERVDANAHIESAYSEMTMTIRTGRRELVKEMHSWADGSKALVEFRNPADQGTKYLKLADELWMYFPDADDLVKISGHMLRQGMMGSDFSYQDALESERMVDLYEFTVKGSEPCAEGTCYVVDATARAGVEVTYALRRIWVDTERFVVKREELMAPGGRLLKVSEAHAFQEIDERYLATRITMKDVLRRDSLTTLVINRIELNPQIPEELFTLRSLSR